MSELVIKDDLRQRDIEQLSDALAQIEKDVTKFYDGALLRAAVETGWIVEPDAEKVTIEREKEGKKKKVVEWQIDGVDVGDLHPFHVRQWAAALDTRYRELRMIDPNS